MDPEVRERPWTPKFVKWARVANGRVTGTRAREGPEAGEVGPIDVGAGRVPMSGGRGR